MRKVLRLYGNQKRGVCVLPVSCGAAHPVGHNSAGLRRRRHHIAARAHTEGIGRAAVRQMTGQTIICRRELSARFSVLRLIDGRLPVLDPHAHGKGFRFHGDSLRLKPAEGIPRAVSDGKDQSAAGKFLFLAVMHIDGPRQASFPTGKAGQSGAEADLPSQADDALPQVLNNLE